MRNSISVFTALVLLSGCLGQTPGKEPDLSFSGPFEKVVSLVRALPPCDTVIGMSWGQTFPVPVDDGQGTRVRVYFYPITGKGGQANQIYNPVAEAVVEIEKGAAVVCGDVSFTPKKVGDIPAPDPNRKPEALFSLVKKQQELYRRTEAVIPAYYARKTREASPADKALASAFLESFEGVVKPERGLLPYYYQANPDFWEWIRKAAGRSIPAA